MNKLFKEYILSFYDKETIKFLETLSEKGKPSMHFTRDGGYSVDPKEALENLPENISKFTNKVASELAQH